jgi:glycosyltransferase involved in cell wall biosynthesis
MIMFIDGHHLGVKKHGVQKFLTGLVTGLSEFNSSTRILVGVKKNEFEGLKGVFRDNSIELMPYSTVGILRFLIDIPLIICKRKIDVFYGQYFIPFLTSRKTKYFFTVHDILYEEQPKYYSWSYIMSRRILIKWGASRADKIFTISQYSKYQLHARYSIEFEKIIVIPIQIDPPKESAQREDGLIKNNILYVSRFEERKNHEKLIHLFSRIDVNESVRLVLVGFEVDGTKRRCRQLVKKLGLIGRVDFLENIDSSILDDFHVTSRIVIYPSLCEGLGMPVLEALLANSRVLFSGTTSMSEFTFASRHMFNPLDEEDMYDKVIKLLRSPKLYENDHDLTISFIQEHYNIQNISQQYSENMRLER